MLSYSSHYERWGGRQGAKTLIVLFEPQPLEFLRLEAAPPRIYRWREKALALDGLVDYVLLARFDETFSKISATDFIETILLEKLAIKGAVVGSDFRFGHRREGDIALLEQYSESNAFELLVHDEVKAANARVSSTQIREGLAVGDFGEVQRLMGRKYALSGRVMHGEKRGRTIGVPTANIDLKRHKIPLSGVFAACVSSAEFKNLPAVVNIGTRPTFDGNRVLLEVHLIDFEGDLYDKKLTVTFEKKIREEQKFSGIDTLKAQITQDIGEAAKILEPKVVSEDL